MMPESNKPPAPFPPQKPPPKKHQKRNDIQGLRAFAIIAVLIYHLKARWLPFGYLGVDMFFVISGFLMAFLLSAKGRITIAIAWDFYYRRLRRIAPTYLFVVFVTLLLAIQFINEMDRLELVKEARSALFLYANLEPLFEKVTYFQMLNNYRFFAHTWSLCVEMQFYLVVPLIFYVFSFCGKIGKLSICAIVGILAFCGQLLAPDVYVHGFTPLRLWQFMIGIAVFYWTDGEEEENEKRLDKEREIKDAKIEEIFAPDSPIRKSSNSLQFIYHTNQQLHHLCQLEQNENCLNLMACLVGATFIMLTKEHWLSAPFARLMCTLMAGFIIKVGAQYQSIVLTNKIAMWIGDHSYTIYLVHWPLIVYWRYLFGHQLTLIDCFYIVSMTLILTCVIDFVMERVMSLMSTKTSTLMFILILFLACEPLMGFLSKTGKNKKEISVEDELEVKRLIQDYYDGMPLNLNNSEALRLNSLLYGYAREFKGCKERRGLNASHLHPTHREVFVCREEGFGQKRALIIGNSLARHAFVGIAHHFRSIYSTLQLHAIENCSPFVVGNGTDEEEEDCKRYAKSLEPTFKEFRPDVIFVIYRFPETMAPFEGPNDPILQAMQRLYNLASFYAREMVFIPSVEVRFRIFQPMDAILDSLRVGTRLTQLRMSRWAYYYNRNRPAHWARVRHAKCNNCLLVDWSLATAFKDACFSVDLKSKLTHYVDRLHVSDIGSFHYGELMKQMYDEWLEKGRREKLNRCINGICFY